MKTWLFPELDALMMLPFSYVLGDPTSGALLCLADFIDSSMLLWAGGVVIAVGLLAASMNRRRKSLVEILRGFVTSQLPPPAEDSKEDSPQS